jgi:hypothetical protein
MKRTREEYQATAMLLGADWRYDRLTNTFWHLGDDQVTEEVDADTMEPLSAEELLRRHQEKIFKVGICSVTPDGNGGWTRNGKE